MDYQIDILKVGEFTACPGAQLYWMSNLGDDEWEPLAVYAMLVRGGGRTILINSGPPLDELETLNAIWMEGTGGRQKLVVREEDRILNRLAALHVDPADVQDLILTPLQSYATGGMDLFPNARIWVNRYGWGELFAPRWKPHPHDRLHMCIEPRLITYAFVDAWERLMMMENEHDPAPGVHVFWTGVHHRSSVAVQVQTRQGTVVFSDCFFRYENITQNRILGINENMYEALAAYERIRRTADILVPMYDLRVLEDHPGGRIGYHC
ncbi:MAG: hypothetical protein WHZ52_10765 [Armatimonadota bacterium]